MPNSKQILNTTITANAGNNIVFVKANRFNGLVLRMVKTFYNRLVRKSTAYLSLKKPNSFVIFFPVYGIELPVAANYSPAPGIFSQVTANKKSSAAVPRLPADDLRPLPDKEKLPPANFRTPTDDLQTASADLRTASADLQTVPADLQTGPADLKSVPADLKSVPADLKSVPADLKSGPADLKSVPADLQTGPADLKSVPADLKSGPADLQTGSAKLQMIPQNVIT